MDRERLELSAEAIDKKAKKAQKKEQKQLRRRKERNERKARRIAPYIELAERNRKIFERAKTIVDTEQKAGKQGDYPSTIVVLGITKKRDNSPRKNVVAQLVEDPGFSPEGPTPGRVIFAFLAVTDEDVEKIKNDPAGFKINTPGWAANADILGEESTYTVGLTTSSEGTAMVADNSEDEFVAKGDVLSPGRAFNPIGAISRALDARAMPSRLDELESTINMVEEAANNPELNPVLAANLAISNSAHQEASSS